MRVPLGHGYPCAESPVGIPLRQWFAVPFPGLEVDFPLRHKHFPARAAGRRAHGGGRVDDAGARGRQKPARMHCAVLPAYQGVVPSAKGDHRPTAAARVRRVPARKAPRRVQRRDPARELLRHHVSPLRLLDPPAPEARHRPRARSDGLDVLFQQSLDF